jgi:hypothetical protein
MAMTIYIFSVCVFTYKRMMVPGDGVSEVCAVRWNAPVSMQLYALLMRTMYTGVPMWAICRVEVIRNDIRRLLPDRLLEQRLNSLPVTVWSDNPSEVVVMKYRQNISRESEANVSTDFVVDTRHIQVEHARSNVRVFMHVAEVWRVCIRDFLFLHSLRMQKRGLSASELVLDPPHPTLEFKVTINSKPASDDQVPSRRYPICNCRILESNEQGVTAISYRLRGASERHASPPPRGARSVVYAASLCGVVGSFKNASDVIMTAYMTIIASISEFDTLARISLDPPLPPMDGRPLA